MAADTAQDCDEWMAVLKVRFLFIILLLLVGVSIDRY
jgi:hypothetical protein